MNENLVETISAFAKALSIPVTKTSIRDKVQQLSFNDSMYVISKVLDHFNIENLGCQMESAKLTDAFCPFIAAVTQSSGTEFCLVSNINNSEVTVSHHQWRNKILTRTDFDNNLYSGVVLLAEPNAESGEVDYRKKRYIESVENFAWPLLQCCLVFGLAGIFVRNDLPNIQLSLIFSKLVGLVVSILLILQLFDSKHQLLDKTCSSGENVDCKAVLNSSASKIFSWLSLAELGFFYFSSTLLIILFNYSTNISHLFAYASILLLPIPFVSLYHQKFVLKKWCLLCCLVQVCIIVEVALSYNSFISLTPLRLNFPDIYALILCFLIPPSVWFSIKPSLVKLKNYNSITADLARFKYNTDLFQQILSTQQVYSTPSKNISIVLGNPDSENVLTVVSNPYCTPCGSAHKAIDKLIQNNLDVQIRIILTESNNDSLMNKHLLALYSNNSEKIDSGLIDWFNGEKDYVKWSGIYPQALEPIFYEALLIKQKDWCYEAKIESTPLILINGYQLPSTYSLDDLQYLL